MTGQTLDKPLHFAAPLANLMCVASMMIWAAGLPAANVLIPLLPPLALAAARMALAAVVLIPVWLIIEGPGTLRSAPWGRGLLIGGGTIGLGAFLLIIGQSHTNAVTVALISTTMPLIGALIEWLRDGRALTWALGAGILLSIIGGLVAVDLGSSTLGFGLGALSCFASVVAFTIGSRLTVTAFPKLTPLGQTAITLAGAALATVIAAIGYQLLGGPAADWAGLGLRGWGALAMFGVGGLAISQLLWIMGVGSLGITLSSLHLNATPFYVMIILYLLGSPWIWMQALGAAIVALGVLVAQDMIRLPRS